MTETTYYGALEVGGSQCNALIVDERRKVCAQTHVPTEDPQSTLSLIGEFFLKHQKTYPIKALGVGSFGSLDVNPNSPGYGTILNAPKANWAQVPLRKFLSEQLKLPVMITTHENAAAMGEYFWGHARGLKNFIYVSVGTGISGGVFVDGKPMQGIGHPEIGHMLVPRHRKDLQFFGCCKFHGHCLEGLASGTAMAKRWGAQAPQLRADSAAWALEGFYLGVMCHNLCMHFCPQKIIIGGGVMAHEGLIELVQKEFMSELNGYSPSHLINHVEEFVVLPKLGHQVGLVGALGLVLH
jgi:fructokinase